MSWKTDWVGLDARIRALLEAGNFYLQGQAVSSDDPYGVASGQLMPSSQRAFEAFEAFAAGYEASLPSVAKEILSSFLDSNRTLFTDGGITPFPGVKARLTALAALRSELGHHLQDAQAVALSLTERAFLHLQRSITADPDVRARWKAAFARGERACESLGATHLLQHGIWAFKISEAGEQTDLVLDEPLSDADAIERVSEGLVLTEWKLVREPGQEGQIVGAALKQAERYGVGILATIELRAHRYLVLVSEKHLPAPIPAQVKDGITYHGFNLVVDPDPPSQS